MKMSDIEVGKIITISRSHLHPETIAMIEAEKGDLSEGPSIALREEGFLLNSDHGVDDALSFDLSAGLFASLHDRAPDVVLIRALARGLKAEWINIDTDGSVYNDILPMYGRGGHIDPPQDPQWKAALSDQGTLISGAEVVKPTAGVLSMIEAGQTPHAWIDREILLDYEAFRSGRLSLAEAPTVTGSVGSAEDWASIYGAMISYESALDAAGYEQESEMREPGAPVLVTLARIFHDGSVEVHTPATGVIRATAAAIMVQTSLADPASEDDSETPGP